MTFTEFTQVLYDMKIIDQSEYRAICQELDLRGDREMPAKPVMSKPAETKVIRKMEAFIAAHDAGGIWETWSELSEAQQIHLNSVLDRWRRAEWKAAIDWATSVLNITGVPETQFPEGFE